MLFSDQVVLVNDGQPVVVVVANYLVVVAKLTFLVGSNELGRH